MEKLKNIESAQLCLLPELKVSKDYFQVKLT